MLVWGSWRLLPGRRAWRRRAWNQGLASTATATATTVEARRNTTDLTTTNPTIILDSILIGLQGESYALLLLLFLLLLSTWNFSNSASFVSIIIAINISVLRHLRSSRSQRKDRGNLDASEMAPFQTTVNVRGENVEHMGQEVIEVQILPQDENWGENTTAVTGNTSDRSESTEDVSNWPNESEGSFGFTCNRYVGPTVATVLGLSAFLSPIAMVVLPKIGFFPESNNVISIQKRLQLLSCNAECKGQLVGLAFKLLLLGIGSWAVFLRRSNATMPRIFLFRSGVLLLTLFCICTYWLFYVVQVCISDAHAPWDRLVRKISYLLIRFVRIFLRLRGLSQSVDSLQNL